MKYFLSICLVILLLFCIAPMSESHSFINETNVIFIARFSKGELYRLGKINILMLQGNYYEMGEQYGALLKDKLHTFYKDIINSLVIQRGIPYITLEKKSRKIFATYPHRFKEIIYGMSATSGLTLKQQLIVNAFEHYLFNAALDRKMQGCSAIAVWNGYSKNGALIFGRNYDFGLNMDKFKKYLTIAVFNPTEAGNPTAIITFAGTLNATTEMNSKGLFLELNNGGISTGNLRVYNRVSTPIELFAMLLDSDNLSQLNYELHTINSESAFIINIADQNKAYSYEYSSVGIKRLNNKINGLLVSTNHFINPHWATVNLTDKDYYATVLRRKNLLLLGKKYKGRIDISIMKKILNIPIKDKGATSYNGKYSLYTTFQIIAEPKIKTIWIKEPNYQDWEKIELDPFFK